MFTWPLRSFVPHHFVSNIDQTENDSRHLRQKYCGKLICCVDVFEISKQICMQTHSMRRFRLYCRIIHKIVVYRFLGVGIPLIFSLQTLDQPPQRAVCYFWLLHNRKPKILPNSSRLREQSAPLWASCWESGQRFLCEWGESGTGVVCSL